MIDEPLEKLPVERMRIIDLTLDRVGVRESLMKEVLFVERPDLEKQRRALLTSIQKNHQDLDRQQVQYIFIVCRNKYDLI